MNHRHFIASLVVLCLPGLVGEAFAQSVDAIESAERALKSTRQPWYDADSDDVKPLIVDGGAKTGELKRSDWRGTKRSAWNWNGPNLSWLGEFFKYLVWAILIFLLAALIYALVQSFLNIDPLSLAGGQATIHGEDTLTDEERIENLPVQPKQRKGDFLAMARQDYEAGNFAEAIVYLFSHRLLQLDKAGFIRLTKGKTNRQYLTELQSFRDLQQILGQTTGAFEDVFFGNHTLSRERFEGCWSHNEQFQQMMRQVMS